MFDSRHTPIIFEASLCLSRRQKISSFLVVLHARVVINNVFELNFFCHLKIDEKVQMCDEFKSASGLKRINRPGNDRMDRVKTPKMFNFRQSGSFEEIDWKSNN